MLKTAEDELEETTYPNKTNRKQKQPATHTLNNNNNNNKKQAENQCWLA